jgi:hypothetical protein
MKKAHIGGRPHQAQPQQPLEQVRLQARYVSHAQIRCPQRAAGQQGALWQLSQLAHPDIPGSAGAGITISFPGVLLSAGMIISSSARHTELPSSNTPTASVAQIFLIPMHLPFSRVPRFFLPLTLRFDIWQGR